MVDNATVYIETTIAGHRTSRLPLDVNVATQMLTTREWWATDRERFDPYTSRFTLDEAGQGDAQAAADRLQALADLPLLPVPDTVDALVDLSPARAALPAKARGDAIHLAIAATTGMDYLLTWTCRHSGYATVRAKVVRACRDTAAEPPVICTPMQLREVRP